MDTKKPIKLSLSRARPAAGGADERLAGLVSTEIALGGAMLEVYEFGVGHARMEIPRLIRDSARTGRAFHIRNAKNPQAEGALLLSPQTLQRWVFRTVQQRTGRPWGPPIGRSTLRPCTRG
jgi:hypothetical protein